MVDPPNQQEVREINRMLLEAVRSDWAFPHPRPDSLISRFAGEPLAYRERYFSTTDDEGEDEEEARSGSIPGSSNAPEQKKETDPYMFDSPDSVELKVGEKIRQRKRRKTSALEEEMKYNGGFCFFMRRRNAWTGAVTREQTRTEVTKPPKPSSSSPVEMQSRQSSSSSSSSSSKLSASAADAKQVTAIQEDNDSAIAVSLDPLAMASSSSSSSSSSSAAATAAAASPPHLTLPTPTNWPFECPVDPSSLTNVYVPLAAPIVPPSHPVRASILARSDSELYEKIVRDNRTPAVPINLAQMTRIIVQGWKDEGNWPPKASVLEPPIAGKRRLTKAVAVKGGGGALQNDVHKGLLANHRHLRQGVDSVKRVLRLSGNAPPPGD